MNAAKEIHALSRVCYLLEENSIRYLATQNKSFEATVERLYHDVHAEITRLQQC